MLGSLHRKARGVKWQSIPTDGFVTLATRAEKPARVDCIDAAPARQRVPPTGSVTPNQPGR